MTTLIKDVHLPLSSTEKTDVIIKDGILKKYHSSHKPHKTIEGKELYLIPAYTDIGTYNGEPGYEERETLSTLTASAQMGGYGCLLLLPHTLPVADEGSQVRHIERFSGHNNVELKQLGSISVECKGVELAEILDMTTEGAVGFTDGYKPVQSAGLMTRALDYAKRFNSVIVNAPHEISIAGTASIHEGKTSTILGLPGIPSIAETMMLRRDISLLEYTQSRLHVWNVSTAEALDIIREAKDKGLDITCSVSYLHLIKDENAVRDYDVNFKVFPPLRTEKDREALLSGILDGTIDCITSAHRPWNEEAKKLEFVHAETGTAGLELVLPALWTYVPELRNWKILNRCLNVNPRHIFGLKPLELHYEKSFNGTLVDAGQSFIFDESHTSSKGKNYPFIGEEMIVSVIKI